MGKPPVRSRKTVKTSVAFAEARREPAEAPPAPVPVPVSIAPPVAAVDYTALPSPADLDAAVAPDAPAPPPGRVPAGNSRSLRRGDDFALVYQHETHLLVRAGTVGRAGAWRVVEYPTIAAATRAYALECSRLCLDGFTDYAS